MKTAGIRNVRLPLGWWAFVDEADEITRPDGRPSIVTDPVYSNRKFVAVTHDYLIDVLEMFARNGVSVLLDLHAYPGGSSDGSYNGIYPLAPVFFTDNALKEKGFDIVQRLCDFYNNLPAYLQITINGVTLMNEPGHMLPDQGSAMTSWVATACSIYRTTVVENAGDIAAPLLYVNFIDTVISGTEIVQFFIDTFTEAELADWVVMDIHFYFAWNNLAATCIDNSAPGCVESFLFLLFLPRSNHLFLNIIELSQLRLCVRLLSEPRESCHGKTERME